MFTQLNFSIGGFKIRLASAYKLEPDDSFIKFLSTDLREPDILVDCRKKDDSIDFQDAQKVFTSENEHLKFYEIYRKGTDLLFAVYNQQHQAEIQQIALLDSRLMKWIIWSDEINGVLEPLSYPMAPILLHYATLTADAVMMHASGVFDGECGRLFSGFSGAGKSTISGIWRDAGNLLINDDRLIIRREKDRYFMYNTPMFYTDDNKKAPLDSVFLIRHAPENALQKLSGASAVAGIMAFSIQNNYDKRFVAHHLDFFSKMCETIPIYKLGFVPNKAVMEFVKKHATTSCGSTQVTP